MVIIEFDDLLNVNTEKIRFIQLFKAAKLVYKKKYDNESDITLSYIKNDIEYRKHLKKNYILGVIE